MNRRSFFGALAVSLAGAALGAKIDPATRSDWIKGKVTNGRTIYLPRVIGHLPQGRMIDGYTFEGKLKYLA